MKIRVVGERSQGGWKTHNKVKDKHAFRKTINKRIRRRLKCKDTDKEIDAKVGGYRS